MFLRVVVMLSLVLLNLILKVLGTNPPEFFLTGETFELCFNVLNLLSLKCRTHNLTHCVESIYQTSLRAILTDTIHKHT